MPTGGLSIIPTGAVLAPFYVFSQELSNWVTNDGEALDYLNKKTGKKDLQSIISTLSAHAQRPVDFAVETTADKLLKIEDVLALAK